MLLAINQADKTVGKWSGCPQETLIWKPPVLHGLQELFHLVDVGPAFHGLETVPQRMPSHPGTA